MEKITTTILKTFKNIILWAQNTRALRERMVAQGKTAKFDKHGNVI